MSFTDNKVTILNYNPFTVMVPTETRTYTLNPCYDYNVPTLVNMSFSDVEYVNSHSDAFRNGLLLFRENQQEEIYKKLSIFEWENILTNQDIQDILLNPTMDGLQKIVDIKNQPIFERVYAILTHLKNSNVDLSNRVIKLVETRYSELRHGTIRSEIVLQERDTKSNSVNISESEADKLKEQNNTLVKQLDEMKTMMAQLIAKQNEDDEKAKSKVEIADTSVQKKSGRPAKAK